MYKSLVLFFLAILSVTFSGCMVPDVEPQQRIVVDSPKETIVRDFYEATVSENKEIGSARFYQIFNNLSNSGNYSVSVVELNAGESLALHQLSSSEMLIVLEGAGMLKVNDIAYILKKGQFVLIPANAKQSTLNNSSSVLRFVTMISPPYDKKNEKILAPPQPPVPVAALKDTSPSDDIAADVPPTPSKNAVSAADNLIGKTPLIGKKTTFKDVQELTPKEQEVQSVPALK